jgi:transcriptional regulator with XRE-family HTH domain
MAGQGLPFKFGSHVRDLRQARGLTQQELADRSSLSVDAIRRIERGALSPSLDTLHKLSNGLKISLPTLFRGFAEEGRDELAEICDFLAHLDARQLQTAWQVIQAMFNDAP